MAARITAAVGDPAALLAIAIELNAALSVADAQLVALEKRRESERARKRHQRHGKSRDVTGQDGTSGAVSPLPMVSLLPPTPPNNTSLPLSPSRLDDSTRAGEELDEGGEGQRYPVSPAIMAGHYGSVIRGAMTDEEWQLVERFLATRPPAQQGDWLREIAKLIGPASGCTPADVECALSDALLLAAPLRSAHALRAFVRTSRDERRRESQPPPSRATSGESPYLTPEMRRWAAEQDAKDAKERV